jgi:hypothetical protein
MPLRVLAFLSVVRVVLRELRSQDLDQLTLIVYGYRFRVVRNAHVVRAPSACVKDKLAFAFTTA